MSRHHRREFNVFCVQRLMASPRLSLMNEERTCPAFYSSFVIRHLCSWGAS